MSRKAYIAFLLLLSISIAGIVWITLLNRIPEPKKVYWIPFYSYYQVINGNTGMLIENIENIILFVPFGFFLSILLGKRNKSIVISGFLCSLAIEVIQLITGLGSFEVDDLIHNALGSALGMGLATILHFNSSIVDTKKLVKHIIMASVLAIVIVIIGDKAYDELHRKYMIEFASMSDRVDAKNLLILDGIDGYAKNSDVYVKYQNDGSISISGSSEVRTWYKIADISLETGTYVFAGMSGVAEKTVAIELEYYNKPEQKYMRLIPDVGPVEQIEFSLAENTLIRAYVGVYPGVDYSAVARPAIYKQGE